MSSCPKYCKVQIIEDEQSNPCAANKKGRYLSGDPKNLSASGEKKLWPADFCDDDFCVGNKAPKAERGDLNSQDHYCTSPVR